MTEAPHLESLTVESLTVLAAPDEDTSNSPAMDHCSQGLLHTPCPWKGESYRFTCFLIPSHSGQKMWVCVADDLVWDADDIAVLRSHSKSDWVWIHWLCVPSSEGHGMEGMLREVQELRSCSPCTGIIPRSIYSLLGGPRSWLKPCPTLLQGWVVENAGAHGWKDARCSPPFVHLHYALFHWCFDTSGHSFIG